MVEPVNGWPTPARLSVATATVKTLPHSRIARVSGYIGAANGGAEYTIDFQTHDETLALDFAHEWAEAHVLKPPSPVSIQPCEPTPMRIGADKARHAHYQGKGGMEPVHVVEAFDLGFNLGNAIKYLLRAGRKGSDTKDADLVKALQYISRERTGEWREDL